MIGGVLIIGKIPPPIGGVTIHVQRLLQLLKSKNIEHLFVDLRNFSFFQLIKAISSAKVVHIHVSNIFFQSFLIFLSRLFGKKTIMTFHGDLKRFRGIKKIFSRVNVGFSSLPILLNENSFDEAIKINNKSVLMSVFIPPIADEILDKNIIDRLRELKNRFKYIFATNGSAFNYDMNGQEIYGIVDLVNYFNSLPVKNSCLVISDPSKEYEKYFTKNPQEIGYNVFFISEDHSYFQVLKLVDASIRNTSTDGDSISVRESLFLNKFTFATDIVSRPHGSILYERGDYNFVDKIESFKETFVGSINENIIEKLSDIYN